MTVETIQPSADTIETMEWAAIRAKRNILINESDHTQISDSPLSLEKKSEFSAYRQELRDLPQTFASIDDVVWPVKPQI